MMDAIIFIPTLYIEKRLRSFYAVYELSKYRHAYRPLKCKPKAENIPFRLDVDNVRLEISTNHSCIFEYTDILFKKSHSQPSILKSFSHMGWGKDEHARVSTWFGWAYRVEFVLIKNTPKYPMDEIITFDGALGWHFHLLKRILFKE